MEPDKQSSEGGHFAGGLRSKWNGLSGRTREILSTIGIFAVAILLAYGLTKLVIQSYQVDGQSMESTLSNNDRLIVNKIPRTLSRISGRSYIPRRADIVIFNQSGLSFGSDREKQLIKRVIGLPGERVVVKDGRVLVYNKEHPNGYEPDKTGQYHIDSPITPGNVDITLRSDEVFVCGDNRTNSEDSRYFGPVAAEKIVGKLSVRVVPLSKVQHF